MPNSPVPRKQPYPWSLLPLPPQPLQTALLVDMTAGQAHPTIGLEARPVLPALFVTTWSLEERLSNDSLLFAFTQRGCRQGNIDLPHCKHWRLTPVGSQDEDQAIKRTLCDVDGRVCNSVPVGVSNLCSRTLDDCCLLPEVLPSSWTFLLLLLLLLIL